jgi:hypothetical protein
MIIFGAKPDRIQLGDAGTQVCPICRETTEHSYVLGYRYFHLYYIFGVVTERRYACLCRRCNNGAAVERKDLPSQFAHTDPIPFLRRYGLLVGPAIGLVGAFLLCFILLKFVIK